MKTIIERTQELTVTVAPRPDQPGYIVQAVRDERTAQVPAESLAEAHDLADCFRQLATIGLAESLFND